MADGEPPRRPLANDGFLRFLLPAPKPMPVPGPSAQLAPPHRLVAPPLPLPQARPRPDERLFIVPPTRPSWLPPPPPPMPPPPPFPAPRPFPAGPEPRMRNAGYFSGRNGSMGRKFGAFFGNGDRAGFERRNVLGAFAGTNGGEAGVERRKVSTQREKKVWVAVEKKGENGSDEDQAADGGGYAGRDERRLEAEDQLEPEEEQDCNGRLLGEDVESSLVIAGGDHECHDDGGGGKLPNEHISSQSIQAPHLRIRMRRRWVECRHDIGTFTSGLLSIYESLKPSEEHKSKQKLLVGSLAKSVSKKWPNAQLHLYGSCANSFGTSHSDVDVCLEIEIGSGSATEVLLTLAEILRTDNFENVEAITSARVPIVRMSDPGSGFSCDICVNNLFAVANTKLLKDYAQIDERLLQLAFIVKHWAKLRGVNETYRGTLSSYAYVLMCINFLQLREPKILPCLQDKMAPYFAPAFRFMMLIQAMEPTYTMVVDDNECAYFDEVHQFLDFGAENKESIAELLWAFFHYWAFHHDYGNDVISVRMGKTVSKQEKNWTTRVGNDRHLMCIEDPFETSHDLGRAVDRQTIRILREEFERAAAILQYDDDPCVALFEPYDHEL